MRALFLTVAALLAALLLPLSPAVAARAETEPSPVAWAVQPGDAKGPDGRSWVEMEAAPGESREEHVVVRNLGREETTFALKAADGYFTDKGRFTMLPSSQPSVGAGTWVTAPSTVTVPAGQQRVLAFMVKVPHNATPGDHAAGLAATITTPGSDGRGNKMGVESRVGFRVMVRVTGEVQPRLEATADLSYTGSGSPVAPGRADLVLRLRNTGNTRLAVPGTVVISGPLGLGRHEVQLGEVEDTLPGEERTVPVRLDGVWPLFVTTAQVTLAPTSVGSGAGDGGEAGPRADETVAAPEVSLQASAASLPWPQLAVLVLLSAAIALISVLRKRRRRALEDRLAQAREQGRLAALTEAGVADTGGLGSSETDDGTPRWVEPDAAGPVSGAGSGAEPGTVRDTARSLALAPVLLLALALSPAALPAAGSPSADANPAEDGNVVSVEVSIAPTSGTTPTGPTGPQPTGSVTPSATPSTDGPGTSGPATSGPATSGPATSGPGTLTPPTESTASTSPGPATSSSTSGSPTGPGTSTTSTGAPLPPTGASPAGWIATALGLTAAAAVLAVAARFSPAGRRTLRGSKTRRATHS